MDKQSVEFGEALLKIREEFTSLTGGRNDLTVNEIAEVMKYILARCDFNKPEEQLTNEEGAWKITYDASAREMSNALGAEQWKDVEKNLIKSLSFRSGQKPLLASLMMSVPELKGYLFSKKPA